MSVTTLPFDAATTLAWALSYSARGWHVFPAPPEAKMSYKSESVHGTKWGATTDPDQIRADFARWPDANVGVRCGAESGLFVIETDEKDGRDGAANLAALGDLPHTYSVVTPSGSVHHYFRHPGGDFRVRNSESKLALGVDVRGDGGMVIAPPSRHKSGAGYYTVSDAAEVAAAPGWLLALVDDKRKSVTVAAEPVSEAECIDSEHGLARLAKFETDLRNAAEGERNATLNTLALMAGKLTGGGMLRRATAIERLTAVALEIGLEEGETAATINSGFRKGLTEPERSKKTAAEMFGGLAGQVAAIAANAGASLSSPAGIPMDGGQAELTRLATPTLEQFLADTSDAPTVPAMVDPPTLPAAMSGHGLYSLLNEAILRTIALAEQPKFNKARCTAALAVLRVAHKDIFDTLQRRIEGIGKTLADSKIKLAALDLEDRVQRAFVKQDAFITDTKGLPESDNPDNVVAALGIISAEVRWNAWLNRSEIRGYEWSAWQPIDDVVIAKLKVRFLRTGTRFRVGNDFLKETLLAIAHENQHDPVVEHVNSLVWDRQPRLVTWLSYTCGVPCDPYHQAVGRNVIGGMVKRACKPGAKHDEVMILIGKQGTAKSTLCRTLAMQDEWFTDSVGFDGSPQNIVPQLFGKLVVELAELDGMARKEVQHIKAFITRQSDNVTLKYKAFASDFERRCIFIGTSNEDSPLVDITGNRRFLPVRVPAEINIAWLRANIEQLVAEAAHYHKAGDEFSIPREVWGIAAEHQESARSIGDVEARLCDWFAVSQYTESAFVSTADLIDLSDIAGWKNVHALRKSVMMRLGFREVMPYIGGIKTRGWLRGPEMLPRYVESVTRYVIGKDQNGRPFVRIRSHQAVTAPVGLPPPPPLPSR